MKSSILTIHNKNIFFFSVMGLFFGLIVNHEIYPVALYSIFIAFFLIIFLSLFQFFTKLKNIQFLLLVMTASLAVKIISIFFFEKLMIETSNIPFLSFKDDYIYDITSSDIANAWKTQGFGFYDDIKFGTGFYSGYPNISALAKFYFYDHYLTPRFLNAFFSTLTIPFYFYTINYLSENKNSNKTITIIFSFSPALIVFSSLQLKETVLIFFISTLLYGTVHFFIKGTSFKSIFLVALSMCALLFFRAAILLPFLVALLISLLISKENKLHSKSRKIKNILWVTLVFLCFYYIWEYLYNTGLLSLTGEEYFDSRFSERGQLDSYQGSNDLGKIGIISILLGPFIALLSLFLPTPGYINFDEFSNTIPYHYFPLIGYYAILPMVCISLFYVLKNYSKTRSGIFIVLFLIAYKLGQAGSKSIFDSRQSLPAIYSAYLLLAYFNFKKNDLYILWKRYRVIVILIMLIVMFSFTFSRYLLRAQ